MVHEYYGGLTVSYDLTRRLCSWLRGAERSQHTHAYGVTEKRRLDCGGPSSLFSEWIMALSATNNFCISASQSGSSSSVGSVPSLNRGQSQQRITRRTRIVLGRERVHYLISVCPAILGACPSIRRATLSGAVDPRSHLMLPRASSYGPAETVNIHLTCAPSYHILSRCRG